MSWTRYGNMLRSAVQLVSRIPHLWTQHSAPKFAKINCRSFLSAVIPGPFYSSPFFRVGAGCKAAWVPVNHTSNTPFLVAIWRADHGACTSPSIARYLHLESGIGIEPHCLLDKSRDDNNDSLQFDPSEEAPLSTTTAANQNASPRVRTTKWTRLPPAPSAAECRELADGPYSALKWIKKCRPDLTHGLLQKMFRKRQVRMVLLEASATSPTESATGSPLPPATNLSVASVSRHKDPPLSKMRRVADSDSLPPGALLFLPVFFALTSPGSLVQPQETRQRRVPHVSPKDAAWLRQLVLYRDAHVVAINKPAGLAVQGGSGVGASVDSLMGQALAFDRQEGPKLVHRLDKDTSGVLLLGRSSQPTRILHSAFREHRIEKRYWALVAGKPYPPHGRVTAPLLKVVADGGRSDRILLATQGESVGTQSAITEYRTVACSEQGLTWLELKPVTGRKHQLRVHCASALKCPVVGDYKYGAWASEKWKVALRTTTLDNPQDRLEIEDEGREIGVEGGEVNDEGREFEDEGRECEDERRETEDAIMETQDSEATTGLEDSVEPVVGIEDGSCKVDAPERVKVKGSLGSVEPLLHLHCRKMVFPNLEAEIGDSFDRGLEGESRPFVEVEAPLPMHMAASWRMLGFVTKGK